MCFVPGSKLIRAFHNFVTSNMNDPPAITPSHKTLMGLETRILRFCSGPVVLSNHITNRHNPSLFCSLLQPEEIEYFRRLKLSDVVRATTTIGERDVQDNLFFWVSGNPCPQPGQLNASTLEPCPFLKGYDYFQVG